jgi:phosphoribosyl-ATP pyrophosphohydrolase/phosphoribosyl-AMP cyclohydrolase
LSNLEGQNAGIRWDDRGLVPVVVQDAVTGRVLMLAYMNAAALARTRQSGEMWFWSRSREELWHKGETSGNTQQLVELQYDCDADALLARVIPRGPACHTGRTSCFSDGTTELPTGEVIGASVLHRLWSVIQDRKANPKDDSYTCHLLSAGKSETAKKLGEEAIEVIVASQSEGKQRLASELADLTYHALVLLAVQNMSWTDVEAELVRRFGQRSEAPTIESAR